VKKKALTSGVGLSTSMEESSDDDFWDDLYSSFDGDD
jgi:hypothetical protein